MRNAKRFVSVTFLFILLFLNSNSFWADAYNGNIIVYVTETGEKYHRDRCTYLKSKIPMTLERASKNYGRCSRCDPPILGQDSPNDTEPYYTYSERVQMEREEMEREEAERERLEKERIAREEEEKRVRTEEDLKKFRFYASIIVPAILFIALFFLIRERIRYVEKVKIHEARCRGELPGGVPGMPLGTIIGEDGLPKQIDSKYSWGPKYTFYISRKGEVFHSNPWCSKGTMIAVHAVYLRERRPCKKCSPVKPDLSWFMPYFQNGKSGWIKLEGAKSLPAANMDTSKKETIKRSGSKSSQLPIMGPIPNSINDEMYKKVIQTGIDESGNKIWKVIFANSTEELQKKIDAMEYKEGRE